MDCLRKLLSIITLSLLIFTTLEGIEKTVYDFNTDPIDVVIPCCSKDEQTLNYCIEMAKKNVVNVRRVIVVSDQKITDEAEWFDEKLYPFSKWDVAKNLIPNEKKALHYYQHGGRVGWYFQQLLKLYAPIVIPDISSNILLLDSDTFFLRKVIFLNKTNGGLYAKSGEYHKPYFKHMNKLVPGLKKVNIKVSGITHHMLIQRPVIIDLLSRIEDVHGIDAWKAFCRCVDNKDLYRSGASEYEIYFNYVLTRTDQVKIRKLKWQNIRRLSDIPEYVKKGYDYVSCHAWYRQD